MEQLLLQSAEARAAFWEAAEWQAVFRQWGEEKAGRQVAESQLRSLSLAAFDTPTPLPKPSASPTQAKNGNPSLGRRRYHLIVLAAAAAMVGACLLLAPLWSSRPVASIVQSSGAVWSEASLDGEPGTALPRGTLRLKEGLAVISLSQGASLVLEAPVELRVRDGNRVELQSGRVRARVPTQAHGFTLVTPGFTVVDLGTEFGCSCTPDGAGEVHVMEGSVAIRTKSESDGTHIFRANQAAQIANGVIAAIGNQSERYLGIEEVTRQEQRNQQARFAAWRNASQEAATQPGLLVHLDFEHGSDTKVLNRANPELASPEASLSGCQWSEGRWPGKGALEFSQPGDRLRLNVKGESPTLTLITWVKLADLETRQHLLAPVGDYRAGEVDWIFNPDGTYSIGVHLRTDLDPARGWRVAHSRAVLSTGKWIMLAAVLDTGAHTATLYLNGRESGSNFLESRTPLRIGEIEIGNSERYRTRRPNFRGKMDELSLYSTALSAEEIHRLYESGRP